MSPPVASTPLLLPPQQPSRGLQRVTMRDVARRAGVNLACVSVVLNGAKSNARVSPEAHERILVAAHELGYKKNGSMSSLAKGRFGCVALLLASDDRYSWLPRRLLDGIYKELAEHNLHLTICQLSDDDLADRDRLPKILREWLTDGILIDYTHKIPDGLRALVDDPGFPAVWINFKQEANCGHPDDFAAGLRATQDLLELGHQRITYLDIGREGDESRDHYSANDRLEGYKAAMYRHGSQPYVFLERDVPLEARSAPIERLLSTAERPTALITGNSDVAVAALWAALAAGLEVPRELSILAIGNSMKPQGNHKLTSYVVPEYELGRRTTNMLVEKISHPGYQAQAVILPFTEVVGNTVGKVPTLVDLSDSNTSLR